MIERASGLWLALFAATIFAGMAEDWDAAIACAAALAAVTYGAIAWIIYLVWRHRA